MNNLDRFVGPKPTLPAGDLEHGSLSAQTYLSVVSVASCSKRIAVFRLSGHEGPAVGRWMLILNSAVGLAVKTENHSSLGR